MSCCGEGSASSSILVAQPGLQMASSQFSALWRLGKLSWLGTRLIRTWRLSSESCWIREDQSPWEAWELLWVVYL